MKRLTGILLRIVFILPPALFAAPVTDAGPALELARQALTHPHQPYSFHDPLAMTEPQTVTLSSGVQAVTAVFRDVLWRTNAPQRAIPFSQSDLEEQYQKLMALPEAQRLKEARKAVSEVQIWLVPPDQVPGDGAKLKAWLHPGLAGPAMDLVYAGRGHGFAWLVYAPLHTWAELQRKLKLEGGEDLLEAAVRESATDLIGWAGARAIPYVQQAIQAGHPQRGDMIFLVCENGHDPALLPWLKTLVNSPDQEVARVARWEILDYPCREAGMAYRKLLEDNAGKTDRNFRLLALYDRYQSPDNQQYLKRMMENPSSMLEYRQAWETLRRAQGRAIPAELLDSEKNILRLAGQNRIGTPDEARARNRAAIRAEERKILASPDRDAAAVIAVSLAAMTGKGLSQDVNNAGIELMRAMPESRPIVDRLRHSNNPGGKSMIESELRMLNERMAKAGNASGATF